MRTNIQQNMRKGRLQMVLNMIKVMEEVRYRKIVALLSVEHGIKEITSKEYLRQLRDAEYIQVKDGLVSLTESYKKQIGLKEKQAETEVKELEQQIPIVK